MTDTCPYCRRPSVPLEQWRVGSDECGNDWLSRGGGRRNVLIAMDNCRVARDQWQTAEIERLAATLAAAEAKIAGASGGCRQTRRGAS
jgi:hypothetical protein